MATPKVKAPFDSAPLQAVGYGGLGEDATPVTAATPLPVEIIAGGGGGGSGDASAANQATMIVSLGDPTDTAADSDGGAFSLIALVKRALGHLTSLVTATTDTSPIEVSPLPATNAARILSAAATTNATSVKASAGTLLGIKGHNARASAVYLKLYNKAAAPTVGTDTPVLTIYLPASTSFALDWPRGFSFATGIALALTTGSADADTGALTAADILGLNVEYR